MYTNEQYKYKEKFMASKLAKLTGIRKIAYSLDCGST
jgi:hypothetical protein